ncbi:L-lactate dehydrogenase [Campylobacter sp. Cr9]|uniref:lactate/malate family dehydrogenase n=1 Tax=Campylobacter sp. Cr9 TaxID=2735728 RepID=UPI0030143BDF|nr:L-lactate dehydrogenase [Campylobacter sp. Cr9]
MKVGVIGLGAVGSAASFMIASCNIANELYLFDKIQGLALASMQDLEDSLEYTNSNSKIIAANNLSELVQCDVIVLAYTACIEPDRTLELKANYEPLKEIIKGLDGFKGIFVIATNPNDSIVYYAQKLSKIDATKVIGTGTTLDSARVKIEIAKRTNVSYKNINAYMLAEHGDTQFLYASNASIAGKNISEFNLNLEEIENKARFKGGEIFKVKGKTEFGIGSTIARIIKAIKDDENLITPLSFVQGNLAYSRPVILGKGGIKKVLDLNLSESEKEKLEISKNYILKTINSVVNFL